MDKHILEQDIPLCSINDLEEHASVELVIEERNLFAIRLDDQIHAYWNNCPHRGIPLNWMPNQFLDANAALIQCASHGALFEIEGGLCIDGPCRGKSLHSVVLHCDNGQYFVTAGQTLPEPQVNLRTQTLTELE